MRISDWSSDVCSSDLCHARSLCRVLCFAGLISRRQPFSLKFKLFRRLEPFHFDPRSRRFQIDRLLEFVASMNTDRLPAIVLRDRDSIANGIVLVDANRSEEHTSDIHSLMRSSYAVFCLKKKTQQYNVTHNATNKAHTIQSEYQRRTPQK